MTNPGKHKHNITPHKGGRTEKLLLRLTPEEKAMIKNKAETAGHTMTDLVVSAVKRWRKK